MSDQLSFAYHLREVGMARALDSAKSIDEDCVRFCEECEARLVKSKSSGPGRFAQRRFCDRACMIKNRKKKYDMLDSFESKLERITESGCWIWMANTRNGYGRFANTSAHRFSYENFVGEIPDGFFVLHRCDTSWCVNPHHLFVGTHRDNMQDMRNKGRQARGEASPSAILTVRQAREIFSSIECGRTLAKRYGISPATVSAIRKGRIWASFTKAAYVVQG